MPQVLIPLAPGCEELEAVTLIDILRRAQIKVVTASLTNELALTASRGTGLIADYLLEDVLTRDFDMIILPGGQPGTNNLDADPRIHQLLKNQSAAGKAVAAICAAPLVLAKSGLLNNRRATCYPGCLTTTDWPEVELTTDAVIIDGPVLTSRGPGTAIDFSLAIIDYLLGKETRLQVEKGLVRENKLPI